ncbi:hypothetical protein [Scytonema sp. UIC 10036]|nr:hypothetical protein [Scytonema sp. UIC 10036]
MASKMQHIVTGFVKIFEQIIAQGVAAFTIGQVAGCSQEGKAIA